MGSSNRRGSWGSSPRWDSSGSLSSEHILKMFASKKNLDGIWLATCSVFVTSQWVQICSLDIWTKKSIYHSGTYIIPFVRLLAVFERLLLLLMLLIWLLALLLPKLVLPLPVACLVVAVFDCWPTVAGLGLGLLPEGLGLDGAFVRVGERGLWVGVWLATMGLNTSATKLTALPGLLANLVVGVLGELILEMEVFWTEFRDAGIRSTFCLPELSLLPWLPWLLWFPWLLCCLLFAARRLLEPTVEPEEAWRKDRLSLRVSQELNA